MMVAVLRMGMLVLLSVMLSGCATSILGETAELKRDGVGYVAATLVFMEESADRSLHIPAYPAIAAHFYAVGKVDEAVFEVNTTKGMLRVGLWYEPRAVLAEPRGARVMSLVQVPPGKYQLGYLKAEFPIGPQVVSFTPADPPIIEVRAGEVTYAGSIQMRTIIGKNIFGTAVPGGSNLRLYDEAQKDIAAMRRVDGRLKDISIIDGLQNQPIDSEKRLQDK